MKLFNPIIQILRMFEIFFLQHSFPFETNYIWSLSRLNAWAAPFPNLCQRLVSKHQVWTANVCRWYDANCFWEKQKRSTYSSKWRTEANKLLTKLIGNTSKTKFMILSTKPPSISTELFSCLRVSNTSISEVTEIKFLGVILSNNLSSKHHFATYL